MAHQNKDIRKAIQYAQSHGWTYVLVSGNSHLKGILLCPRSVPACSISIYGTPRNPTTAAKRIREKVDKCNHGE